METAPAFLTAIIIVAALVIVAAFIWYQKGWVTFAKKTGDHTTSPKGDVQGPCWNSTSGDTSRLRFKDTMFTLNVGGETYVQDVTAVLNGMAAAYNGTSGTLVNSGSLCPRPPPQCVQLRDPGGE